MGGDRALRKQLDGTAFLLSLYNSFTSPVLLVYLTQCMIKQF
jgi:hypothetical protein